MFEAILNKTVPIRHIHTSTRITLISSAVVLLLFVLVLIWYPSIAAGLNPERTATWEMARASLIESAILVLILSPLVIHGNKIINSLTQSQAFFQTLFHDSVEPILLYQFDGRITTCNPAFTRMLGYDKTDLTQMRFQDLIVSDGRELAYLFRTGESGVHAQAKLALQTSDGQVLFVVAHEQRILNHGKVQLLAFLEDVTASHIATQKNKILGNITSTLLETREIRQVHQTVCAEIAQSADSLVVLLGTFNPRYASLDICAQNGSPLLLEQLQHWIGEALPNGLREIYLNRSQMAWLMEPSLTRYSPADQSTETGDQFPHLLIPKDNLPPEHIWARCLYSEEDEVTSILILDYKGLLDTDFIDHLLYFFSTAISRLATQTQLERSQMQLSETQQLVRVGRMQYDFLTDRITLSKELCSLCGMPEDTAVVELIRRIHPDDQPAFAQVMDQVIQYPPHNKVRFNFRMTHADGSTLYLRSQSKIHFDDGGQPLYVITAIHDASEIMSARNLLQQREVDLDTMAKERQLLEEQATLQVSELEHVNKNLNTALMVKDEFLASMSSNLKAPLTAILGTVELMTSENRGALNNDQFRYMNLIERSGIQLLDAINAILDLTRFSLNKEEISQEKVSLHDLCQAGVLYAQPYANRKQVQLQYDLKIKQPYIIGDPIRLRQIMSILLKQAVSSAPENGSVKLNVFTHTDPQFIWIQILDNGTQSISTILEPEEHGVDPNNQQSLELEIASRLIELHGGTLRVLHQKNRGNTMIILLPRFGVLNDHQMPMLPPDKDTVIPQESVGRG